MNKKVIAAGHVCLDITPVFPKGRSYGHVGELLVPGKLINMDGADVHTGGSAANTGLALKLLGANVTLMGKVGNDAFGSMVQKIAASYGAGGLIVDENSNTSYSVVLTIPGIDRIFLHDPGANNTFTSLDIPDEALTDAVLFHFGYPPLMRKMYENDGEELVKMFRRMKEKGIATSLDFAAIDPYSPAAQADWGKILERVMPYTDFTQPSFEELCFMLNRKRYDELAASGKDMAEHVDMKNDAAPMAKKLIELGAGAVLIKRGTCGMYYQTAGPARIGQIGGRLRLCENNTANCGCVQNSGQTAAGLKAWSLQSGVQRCFVPDRVLSGTGAGDASIAAYLMAVLSGKTPQEAAQLAAAEGACAVTAYDALGGIQSLDELQKRIDAGWRTAY